MNFLYTFLTFVFFVFNLSITKSNFVESEINLSSSPLAVCECAVSKDGDPCRETYKDWIIFKANYKGNFSGMEITPFDFIKLKFLRQLVNRKLVILETGSLSENFLSSNSIVFCPRSISEDVLELKIKRSGSLLLAPEAIAERNVSLTIIIEEIKNDIYFPTSLYDYQYKIPDYIDSALSSSQVNETKSKTTFTIIFRDVGEVIINSNSISAKSVHLNVDGATSLTIETLAIRDESSDLSESGISLRKIKTVKLESSWGSSLIIESCDAVYLYPNSVSERIYHFSVYNVTKLNHYANTFTLSRFNSITKIKEWKLRKNFLGIRKECSSSNNETELLHYDSKNKICTINSLLLEETNMILEDSTSSFTLEFKTNKISILNSTFHKQNDSNLDIIFIAQDFDLNQQEFPDWINLCQINESVTCEENFNNTCPVGLPYPPSNETEFFCKPKSIIPVFVSDISAIVFYVFLGLGILALIASLAIAIALIYKYKRLSGNWSPDPSSVYSPFEQSTLMNHHQILCVSARDNPIGTKRFPRHFSRRLSPFPYTESGVQFYTYRDEFYTLPVRKVNANDNRAKNLSFIRNVQLITIRSNVDDVEMYRNPTHAAAAFSQPT